LNYNLKESLKLVEGQMYVISDYEKNLRHHDNAQNLSQNDTYTLLLDITGHNQSMNIPNTQPLAIVNKQVYNKLEMAYTPTLFHGLTFLFESLQYNERISLSYQQGGMDG
jgi:hypothetical protein